MVSVLERRVRELDERVLSMAESARKVFGLTDGLTLETIRKYISANRKGACSNYQLNKERCQRRGIEQKDVIRKSYKIQFPDERETPISMEQIRILLSSLGKTDREVIIAYFYRGKKLEQIARKLGVTKSAAHKRKILKRLEEPAIEMKLDEIYFDK